MAEAIELLKNEAQALSNFLADPQESDPKFELTAEKLCQRSEVERSTILQFTRSKLDERHGEFSDAQRQRIEANLLHLEQHIRQRQPSAAPLTAPDTTGSTNPVTGAAATEKAGLELKEWWPQDLNVREWNGKQITGAAVVGIGSVIGAGALFYAARGIWRWFKGKKAPSPDEATTKTDEEAAKKAGVPAWVWALPLGIGAAIAGMVYLNKKLGGYAGMLAEATKLAEQAKAKGEEMYVKGKEWYEKGKEVVTGAKDRIANPLSHTWEQYGLTEEKYEEAKRMYEDTRGLAVAEIRAIFGLRPDEQNEKYDKFMETMRSANEDIEKRGDVQFVSAAKAIRNYETEIGMVLGHWEQWFAANTAIIGTVAFVGWQKRLFSIRDILKQSVSLPVKLAMLAEKLREFTFDHPLIAFTTVGSAVLGGATAWVASKTLKMPVNLPSLAIVADGTYALGNEEPASAINSMFAGLQHQMTKLQDIGDNIVDWADKQIRELPNLVLNQLPEMAGQKPAEVAAARNDELLAAFDVELDTRYKREKIDRTSPDPLLPNKIHTARAALKQFRDSMAAERGATIVTTGGRVEADYLALCTALEAIGITLTKEDGIVRWEEATGEGGDVCVDPLLVDGDAMRDVVKETRRPQETAAEYVLWRGYSELRVKAGWMMEERGEPMLGAVNSVTEKIGVPIPQNKILAMVVGDMFYWMSTDNVGHYLSAPITTIKGLLTDATSREFWATTAENAGNAFLITAPVLLVQAVKRLGIGGASPFRMFGWNLVGKINPITSPINLVRDASRGLLDCSVWVRTRYAGRTGERIGRVANIMTGKSGIRPEWIGEFAECVEDNQGNIKRLHHLARQMGVEYKGLPFNQLRAGLNRHIEEQIKHLSRSVLGEGRSMSIEHWTEIREGIENWYKARGKFERGVARTVKAMEQTKDILYAAHRTAYAGVEAAAAKIVEQRTLRRLFTKGVAAEELYKKGYKLSALYRAGYTATDLWSITGIPLKELVPVLSADELVIGIGCSIDDLVRAGMRAEKFLDSTLDMGQILSAMRTAGQLDKLVAAANPAQLKAMIDAKATLQELVAARASFKALIDVGQSLDDIAAVVAKAGSDAKAVQQLIKLGMTEARFLAQGGKVADFAKAAIQVERARKWATAGKIAGKGFIIGGAVLDSGIALFVDIPELQRRMDETKDAHVRLDLQRQIRDKEKGIGVNAVLATGSVAPNPFMPIFWGASAAKAFVVDPLSGSTNTATDYMLQTTDSMEAKTPGANLADVGKSAPDTMVSWGQRLTTFQIDAQHQANMGVRRNAYEAYFRSMVPFNIRPMNAAYLSNEDAADPDRTEMRLRQLNGDMERLFVTHAWQYVSFATQGTFVSVDHTVLERAASYARMAVEEERRYLLQPEGYERKLPLLTDSFTAGGPSAKERVTKRIEEHVTAELGARTDARCNKLKEITDPVERKKIISRIILDELIHDLSVLEGKILASNSSGGFFTATAWGNSWYAWTRWTNTESLHATVRGKFVEVVMAAIKGALAKPTFTASDLRKILETVRTEIAKKDLNTLGKELVSSVDGERLAKLGEQPDSLTVLRLQERIFAAPEASGTPADATTRPPSSTPTTKDYIDYSMIAA